MENKVNIIDDADAFIVKRYPQRNTLYIELDNMQLLKETVCSSYIRTVMDSYDFRSRFEIYKLNENQRRQAFSLISEELDRQEINLIKNKIKLNYRSFQKDYNAKEIEKSLYGKNHSLLVEFDNLKNLDKLHKKVDLTANEIMQEFTIKRDKNLKSDLADYTEEEFEQILWEIK
jgi:hypothetical protein